MRERETRLSLAVIDRIIKSFRWRKSLEWFSRRSLAIAEEDK